jgi:hypothetical protein
VFCRPLLVALYFVDHCLSLCDYKTQSDKQWSTKHKATSNGLQNTKRQAMVYKAQSDKQWSTKHKATSNGLQNTFIER